MTIKTCAFLILATSVCLAAAVVAYTNGSAGYLLAAGSWIEVVTVELPFVILWAAAISAKGGMVPKCALALSVVLLVLDGICGFGIIPNVKRETETIVLAAAMSVEMILALLVLVGAVVSRARWEGNGPDSAQKP